MLEKPVLPPEEAAKHVRLLSGAWFRLSWPPRGGTSIPDVVRAAIDAVREQDPQAALVLLKQAEVKCQTLPSAPRRIMQEAIPQLAWRRMRESVRVPDSRVDLRRRLEELRRESDTARRGKMLEDFLAALIGLVEGLQVKEVRWRGTCEELDLIVTNQVNSPFWSALNSPCILMECKNWQRKVGVPAVREFESKLQDHGNIARVGFIIALNGFASTVKPFLERLGRGPQILVLVTGCKIEEFLNSRVPAVQFMENLVVDSAF